MKNKIIEFDELQEKKYLNEKQKDRLKDYKFQYEYRYWGTDDNTADWYTSIKILDKRNEEIGLINIFCDSGIYFDVLTNNQIIEHETRYEPVLVFRKP